MFKRSDFITGNKFQEMVDVIFDGNNYSDIEKIAEKKIPLVFTTTHLLNFLLEIKYKIDVICHNSDGSILPFGISRPHVNRQLYDINIFSLPENIRFVFSQNVCVPHERIFPLPAGHENEKWFPELNKKNLMLELTNKKIDKTKDLYICHGIWTFPQVRTEPYQLFKTNEWCTAEEGKNGANFENFINKVHSHKFMLCPDGNGPDSHRLWETLQVGTYPIVSRHTFLEILSEELPILIVDSWNEITEDYLNKKYEEFNNHTWNWDMLKFSYWEHFINDKTRI